MNTRQTVLKNFSACPLCGHFLASLLALLGDESLENALKESQGAWLIFQWRPAIAGMLTTYYDWHIEPTAEGHSGRCPTCMRRIAYLPNAPEGQEDETAAILQLERRPGSRV